MQENFNLVHENNVLLKQNRLANEALNAIAKQLGFDYFSDDEVGVAIEELLETRINQP